MWDIFLNVVIYVLAVIGGSMPAVLAWHRVEQSKREWYKLQAETQKDIDDLCEAIALFNYGARDEAFQVLQENARYKLRAKA